MPDELQPGQVLAVRPRPALLLPLLPCSHPCPALLCSALPKRKERLHLLCLLCSLCSLCLLYSGHRAAQAQGEAERHREEAAGHSGAGGPEAAAAAEPRLGGCRRSGGVRAMATPNPRSPNKHYPFLNAPVSTDRQCAWLQARQQSFASRWLAAHNSGQQVLRQRVPPWPTEQR